MMNTGKTLKEAMGQMTTAEKLSEASRLLDEAANELAEANPDHAELISDVVDRALDAIGELEMGL